MKHNPIEKAMSALISIKKLIDNGKPFSVVTVLSMTGVPDEYGGIMQKCNIIDKQTPGKRGKTKYRWIGGEPSKEMAEMLVLGYNNIRKIQKENRAAPSEGNGTVLHRIEDKLDAIINMLSLQTQLNSHIISSISTNNTQTKLQP